MQPAIVAFMCKFPDKSRSNPGLNSSYRLITFRMLEECRPYILAITEIWNQVTLTKGVFECA